MKTKIEKLPKSTIKLTVTVETDKVKETYENVLVEAVKNTEVEGFRKGNAPKEMVRDKIGVSTLYGDVINELLKIYYTQALKENKISPISNPRVEIKEFDIEKEFEFTATVAVSPEVKMGDYKKELKKYYEEKQKNAKKDNEEKLKNGEKLEDSHVHIGANEVIDILLKNSQVDIAELLIEEESDRLTTRLIDQLKSINLSVDKYLKAQDKTPDQLKNEYDDIAEKNIKAELVMSHLVKEEKIEISDKEIDEMVSAVGDPSAAERLENPMERLYLKTILQKNKLINKLIEETQGEHKHE